MKEKTFTVLFITVFTTMIGLGVIGPLLPYFAESLGAGGLWLGLIFAGYSISRTIFVPLIGKLSDKKGRKYFIFFGLILYSFVSILYLFSSNLFLLLLVRFIHGLASGFVVPIAMAYIGDISKKGKEGSYMGRFNISLFLGMGAGPLIGGYIYEMFGFKEVFLFMAVLSFLTALFVLFLLPDGRIKNKKNKNISFRRLIKNKIIKSMFLFRLINSIGRGSIMAFLPVLAAKSNISPGQIGVIISVNIFLTSILQGFFGKFSDKHDKVLMIVLGSFITAVSLFFMPVFKGFVPLLILGLLMGLGGAIALPPATALVVSVGKKEGMASSISIFSTAMSLGTIISPIVAGIIVDILNIDYVFYFAGLLNFLGIFVFWKMIKN